MTKPKKSKAKPKTRTDDVVSFVEDLKAQWMATIDALVDPLMIVREDYTISKANLAMAQAAQTTIKGIIGKKCYEVFAQRKSPCPGCHMLDAATQKQAQHYELDNVRPQTFFEVSSQALFDRHGKLEGVVQVYRDRTEAKQLREHLLQSEKLSSIGLLAGGLAHEINNPLGGILVFSQMILREMPSDNPHYQDVKEILLATQRCKEIVESLLDFARTKTAGQKEDAAEVVDVNEAARTAVRFGRVSAPKSLIEIEEDLDPQPLYVNANRNKLIQLFLNLIQNAIQAMPDGGSLKVISQSVEVTRGSEQQVGRWVQIEIADSGVGIPDEYQKKIFDPFFTTKDPGEGTGLGLAICYGIVKDVGGELTFESKVNVGTIFRIRLPAAQAKKNRIAS